MLGVGPMTYQGTPKVKKPKAHARGATIPGPSTPGSVQGPSTPGSAQTGFGGFINTQVPPIPPTPQQPSTPALQTTGSFDSSNYHTVLSDVSTGTKKSGGFFRLFKKDSRPDGARSHEDLPSRGRNSHGRHLYGRSEEISVEPESYDPLDEMGALPTPDFIRPMPGQKLIPRREPNALYRTGSSPHRSTQIGRARAKAVARLNESVSEVSESEWQTTTDDSEEELALADSSIYNETSQESNVITDSEEQHELIILSAAPDGDEAAIAEWTKYIKFYSGGSYNISNPPAPPRRRMDFTYLPAMYPSGEETRIRKHYSIDGPWDPDLGRRIVALMEAAVKRFHIKGASVSVFDERYEKLRVDVGYDGDMANIKRTTSIAAHALYSEEVLIILDTHKDWRFAGNPWVTGSPHIRFFVGAPLISDDGEIIGVFAIFSKQPRSEFFRSDRREMAEFAGLMAKDICLSAENNSDPDLRLSVAVSKRDTRTNLVPNPLQLQKQPSPLVNQPDFFPMGFQFHKQSSPLAKQFDFQNEDVFANSPEVSMSHDSEIRDSDILYMAAPGHGHYRSFSESTFPNNNTPEAFHQFLTPTRSQNFEGSEGRPYSTSDLTSVDMPQNNTPNETFEFEDNDGHFPSDLDGPATPKQPRFVFPSAIYRSLGRSNSGISLNNSFGRLYMEGDSMVGSTFNQELLEPEAATPSTAISRPYSTMSSNSIGTSFSSRIGGPNNDDDAPPNVPQSVSAEANFSCSFSGKRYGFDQVYAVKVDCPYPGMSDQELVGPNGLTLKVLASYGLPFDYESELNQKKYLKKAFLKALRTNEFSYNWTPEEGEELHADEDLGFGVLIPLSPLAISLSKGRGQSRSYDHGIVYAMFNRGNSESNMNHRPFVTDLHGYKCAAQAMTILLFGLEIPKGEIQSTTNLQAPTQPLPNIVATTEVGEIYYSRRTSSVYSGRHSSF
ncbi:hypothetical protein NHQ30_001039 [Ciborinia camelliae]|nr:hypothetical protein NHQ30_001039 [Ciborinia camelliae]